MYYDKENTSLLKNNIKTLIKFSKVSGELPFINRKFENKISIKELFF